MYTYIHKKRIDKNNTHKYTKYMSLQQKVKIRIQRWVNTDKGVNLVWSKGYLSPERNDNRC